MVIASCVLSRLHWILSHASAFIQILEILGPAQARKKGSHVTRTLRNSSDRR